MPSPTSPSRTLSSFPRPHALAGTWMALANVQTQACADWLALCMETSARCALTRSVPEYMTIGSLMLPSCLSHAMHYYRKLSEVAQAGLPPSSVNSGSRGGVVSPNGKAQNAIANVGQV
ncbi:hypothetical protein [Paraburkholderia sacchari]|uniref:Uncharacterized protein n=1 Tax=Paraburkholderia sacchari TaxID=159450 RepID=A0A8T6ZHN0_9BURK|nr:hypothetical protein [Paraburkholderia sacchari]NLP64737.1 hypothetical protein [Paraburkholderia sacchari]